ncbi:hypothetical protein [Streptomyces sp. NPDC098781]|uniref:hypothetical protein n=1 Tax=Streptomyces sp. NPDC098781 TaxID=3366097 RepID=UPI0037F89360
MGAHRGYTSSHRPHEMRVLVHYLPNYFAFAAFNAKMLLLRSERPPVFFRTFGVTT